MTTREVVISTRGVTLPGTLCLPDNAERLVLFAHGSGSSRLSPRNQFVAEALQQAGIGTLLFDLLTDPEARDRRNVFAIELLAERLELAREWVESQAGLDNASLGYFGASTGAAAALVAAADHPDAIGAIVSRGGRPDLAGEALRRVTAPTLLIVGGNDWDVLELNKDALNGLRCAKRLTVVPGATHLFEEPGTLERVATFASDWFTTYLTGRTSSAQSAHTLR
ncbi:MAG TPA: alpha/beta fold hydrolase [Gemmatimonadales bacterium]|nr:alpha/beta fold hydrolase [Gemmatimonadales bacterium]